MDLINQINFITDMTQSNEYFLKSCYLKDNFFAILYFQLESDFNFKVFNLIQESESSFNIQEILTFQYAHTLNIDTTLNEFLKINNNRIAFISTSMDNCLYIIFFDLYEDYTKMVFRAYSYNLYNSPYESIKKLSACLYNGFLAFTTTILPRETNNNEDNYFSLFMIFSYANGTDLEINIAPYFMDIDDYNPSNNLYDYLMNTMIIENNILGYEKIEEIKLVSIPEEILFYNEVDNSPILNNGNIDKNFY